MPNDRADFTPEVRNAALWSGDSRRIAKGDAAGVVLEKLGRTEAPDLSGEEHVQMGHRMQPVVAKIFEEQHGAYLREADYSLTHPKYSFIQSHFDYISDSGEYLVECKNYNAGSIQYYSEPDDEVRVPVADYAQCLHEAIVHQVDTVYLAVLFGGQRYRDFKLTFSEAEKDAHIQVLAEVWGNIQTNTIPGPSTPDQAREIWPQDDSHTIVASKDIEFYCHTLRQWKDQAKGIEEKIDELQTQIMNHMGTRSELVSVDGKTLATWKTAKGSKRFDAKLFQQSMPDLYNQFVVETMGSRRFLVKG
jgi:predicted phage-related endonuclease